jgi:hypothetical protein
MREQYRELHKLGCVTFETDPLRIRIHGYDAMLRGTADKARRDFATLLYTAHGYVADVVPNKSGLSDAARAPGSRQAAFAMETWPEGEWLGEWFPAFLDRYGLSAHGDGQRYFIPPVPWCVPCVMQKAECSCED